MRIVDSHSAEYRERLDKVLVVLRERQIVELIDQLNNADYLPGRVLDGHTKDRAMPERWNGVVHEWIESRVLVSVRYIDSLQVAALIVSRSSFHADEGTVY